MGLRVSSSTVVGNNMKHNHLFSLALLLSVMTAYVAKASDVARSDDFVGPPKPEPVVVVPEQPNIQQLLVEIGCDPFTLTCSA